jgi:hypothetical protein
MLQKNTGSCHLLKLQLPVKRKHRVYTCRSLYLLTRCFPNEGLPTDKTSTDWITFSPCKPLGLIGSIVNRFSFFLRNLFLRWPPQSAIASFPLWITTSLLLLTLSWITASLLLLTLVRETASQLLLTLSWKTSSTLSLTLIWPASVILLASLLLLKRFH